MSRNWYIKTDQRNIQDSFDEINTTPLSFREKWKKNPKKYILGIVGAVGALTLLISVLPDLFWRNKPDYTVTLVTVHTAPQAGTRWLSEALSAVAEDRDGDGEVEVRVRAIATGEDQADPVTQRNILLSSFVTSEYTLFAMEPDCYQEYIEAHEAGEHCLFIPLSDLAAPLTAGGTLWEFAPGTSSLPKTLLLGVRTLSEENTDQQDHLRLLQRFMREK